MTSIDMSVRYVETYQVWRESDAVVVVGFGFGTDDEHITEGLWYRMVISPITLSRRNKP